CGERRIWREPPPGAFILKVSPKNNGSQHLVMGTEDITPGDEFPTRLETSIWSLICFSNAVHNSSLTNRQAMGKSACSAYRCGTRNQNKQPTPLVLLPKESSALSHKQPLKGWFNLHRP
ncbi:MAG: hypothetical protein WB755_06195, partial [Terriglobales bacterium]